jgi:hypothetical protein
MINFDLKESLENMDQGLLKFYFAVEREVSDLESCFRQF